MAKIIKPTLNDKATELYEELIVGVDFEKAADALSAMVSEACESLAEAVNGQADDERIEWLFKQGWTAERIKEHM